MVNDMGLLRWVKDQHVHTSDGKRWLNTGVFDPKGHPYNAPTLATRRARNCKQICERAQNVHRT